MLKHY
jgi:hypothetical protein